MLVLALFAGLFAFPFLFGCQKSSSREAQSHEQVPLTETQKAFLKLYKAIGCEFDLTSGPAAAPVVTPGVADEGVEESYFSKKFDGRPWHALQDLSAQATYQLAQLWGLDVYRVPSDLGDCRMFAGFSTAPPALQKQWDDIANDQGQKDNTLFGLYIPSSTNSIQGTSHAGAILLREDSSRWTLAHEFLHHLFRRESYRHGLKDDELRTRVSEYTQKVEGGKASPEVVLQYFDVMVEMYRRWPLEEMTIETMMGEAYNAHALTSVPRGNLFWGSSYITTEAEKVSAQLTELKTLLETLSLPSSGTTRLQSADIERRLETLNSYFPVIQAMREKASANIQNVSASPQVPGGSLTSASVLVGKKVVVPRADRLPKISPCARGTKDEVFFNEQVLRLHRIVLHLRGKVLDRAN
jgi:hypothetical protein